MRGFQFICFVALVALLGLASADKPVGPPARCLAQGKCEAPAPACTSDVNLFVCDQKTGYWVSNYTQLNISMTIGSPVLFTGNLTLENRARVTFNQSDDALLVIEGHANFTGANDTWIVNVGMDDLDDYAEVEKDGSNNFNSSRRQMAIARSIDLPNNWHIELKQVAACHIVYLTTTNSTWVASEWEDRNGTQQAMRSLDLYFYTKSACWKWIILVGSILAYFALLVVVIVVFRFVPSLKAWTTQPVFDSNVSHSSHVRRIDEDSYELEGNFGARRGNNGFSSNDSDETDHVRLDL